MRYVNDIMFKIKMGCVVVSELLLLNFFYIYVRNTKKYGGMCYPGNYTIYDHYPNGPVIRNL